MDTFDLVKKDILGIIAGIRNLLKKAGDVPGFSDKNFENWEMMIGSIEKQISEEIVRVAVVGPIKSGKSTFVNSVYKGDYLKRGAGVVTSIVTRIRSGTELSASLYFKTWDEINADINDALVLFPLNGAGSDFDIRRSQDRQNLKDAFNALDSGQLIVNNSRDSNSLLLSSYLEGYDRISTVGLSSEGITIEYKGESFQEHKEFVGNDELAVYLRDIQLEIRSDLDDSNIEIADCQGSDSPNPLHLAMIQDYLLQTHFIIYVISSRTGLRQADIRFLSMIKKMGIMENIMFVVNCDFTEHDSMTDLASLVEKISDEISLIKSDPDLFVFSSLFNLFKEKESDLVEKERARLELWKNEQELSQFSDMETERFYESFNAKIREERYQLLLKNHVERLRLIIKGIENWAGVSKGIVTGDADAVDETIRKVDLQHRKMQKITSMIRNTLDGGTREIRNELRKDVDSFFSRHSGGILDKIIEFIRSYTVSFDQYDASLVSSGFTQTLYAIYQEFRQNLKAYMAETINPGIVGFIKEEEDKITDSLIAIAEPFRHMVADAVHEFNTTVSNFDMDTSRDALDITIDAPDIEAVKGISGLKINPAMAVMQYSAKVKTEAVLRFGFYSMVNLFRRVLKKPIQDKKADAVHALKDGIRRMKRETETSIVSHFKNYRENIKFQYIFKLADAVSNKYYDILTEQFQTYITELTLLISLVNQKRIDKKQLFTILKEIDGDMESINRKINEVKEKIIAP
jgi:GTPase SAR1 family protein